MKRRGVILVSVVVVLGAAAAVVTANLGTENRRAAYIWLNDTTRSLGLGLRERDLKHLQQVTRLQDVSAVRCRDCHGASTNNLPWAKPRPHHPAPEGLVLTADGTRLYVAAADTDEVIEVDPAAGRVTRRTRVAGAPTGLALDSAQRRLYVTCRTQDRVAALDLATLSESASVYVGLGPVGLAFARGAAGARLVVANAGSDDISLIDAEALEEITRLPAGREPYAVTCTPDGARAYVVCRLAGIPSPDQAPASELTVIDLARNRVATRPMLESAHLSEGIAVLPDASWVLTPLVRVRNLVPITQVARGWVMSGGLALVRPDGREVIQVPLDEANAYFADPGGIALDPTGRRAYVASGGSDVVSVIDLERLQQWLQGADDAARREAIHHLELSADYVAARIPTRRNPRQLALSADGRALYVAERLEDAILIIDTRTLEPAGRIVLGNGEDDDPIRRGERVFTTARRTFQSQFSCRSCHPDGHADGLAYDFDGDGIGDNLLDNRSLRGVAGSWPFKWNGKNPNLKVQCGPRFARVLMRTEPFSDRELEDLTAFLESLPPARTRHVLDTTPTTAQDRGREVFQQTGCTQCHRPPLYTTRVKVGVGSKGRYDSTGDFDTPHLLGIAASAPYLHDGRARTLEELWTLYQTNDLHGVTSRMSKQQLNDLVEFLKTL